MMTMVFTEEIEPLHVVEGIGDPASGIRDGSIKRDWRPGIDEAGPRGLDLPAIRYPQPR